MWAPKEATWAKWHTRLKPTGIISPWIDPETQCFNKMLQYIYEYATFHEFSFFILYIYIFLIQRLVSVRNSVLRKHIAFPRHILNMLLPNLKWWNIFQIQKEFRHSVRPLRNNWSPNTPRTQLVYGYRARGFLDVFCSLHIARP